jgi:uncharacterized protein YxjI
MANGVGISSESVRSTAVQYPLKLSFKLFSFSQQIAVTDAAGAMVLYVEQKMFRFKERIEVFADAEMKQKRFEINADRIIDFTASYRFTDAAGNGWGSVRREGMRSLWSAHYDVYDEDSIDMTIREEEPWKRLVEGVLGDIPVVGFAVIYWLNPSYLVFAADGTKALRAVKKPSVFERYFEIEKMAELDPDDELRALLSLIMMVLLEKDRG